MKQAINTSVLNWHVILKYEKEPYQKTENDFTAFLANLKAATSWLLQQTQKKKENN